MSNGALVALQAVMKDLPQVSVDVEHFFSEGMYCRLMIVEPDTALVGKTHKHDHIAVLLEGDVAVGSRYGNCIYSAPYVVHVAAGDKRAFYARSKVKWMTIHANPENEKDLEALETRLVEDH